MKILCKNISLGLLSLCFCLLMTTESMAKVCFVGDDDCAQGGDFGKYEDPAADGSACISEGYILKSECTGNRHAVSYCPYNSDYVMCCGNEYVYDSCVYPYSYVGKCGNKYACDCDSNVYKYTQADCEADNAYPAGASCTRIAANPDGTSTIKELLYSTCLCNRGNYPEPSDNCEKVNKVCTDSSGEQYTDSCVCDDRKYPVVVATCDYGGEGKTCIEGGVTKAERCCECDKYPVELVDGTPKRGGENIEKATDWEPCPCPTGKNRVVITQCQPGWQPNSDGDGCVRISCSNAVKLYLSKRSRSNIGVFTGTKVVSYEKLSEAEKAKLPAYQRTYAVGKEIELPNATVGILINNVSIGTCTSPKGIGCTKVTTLKSGLAFAEGEVSSEKSSSRDTDTGTIGEIIGKPVIGGSTGTIVGGGTIIDGKPVIGGDIIWKPGTGDSSIPQDESDAEIVKASCEAEARPVASYASTSFPGPGNFSSELTLDDVSLKMSANSTYIKAPLQINDGNIYSTNNKTIRFTAKVKMSSDIGTTFGSRNTKYEFAAYMEATGYNFDVSSLAFEASSKNSKLADITLPKGGKIYAANGVIVYPIANSIYTTNGSYISIKGPTTSNTNDTASVYADAIVGTNAGGTVKTKGMGIKLTGGVNWKLYDEKTSKITLTTGSYIDAQTGTNGYYAKIKKDAGSSWSRCSMATEYVTPYDGKESASCRHVAMRCAATGDSYWQNRTSYFYCENFSKPGGCTKINGQLPLTKPLFMARCSIDNKGSIRKLDGSNEIGYVTYKAIDCRAYRIKSPLITVGNNCKIHGIGYANADNTVSGTIDCGEQLLSCN